MVNDCFYYFLKNSEPLYAYHALKISESYIKNFLSRTDDGSAPEATKLKTFESLLQGSEPVHNMYDYHRTKEYMTKSTAEKLETNYSFMRGLPLNLRSGSGHSRF